MNRTRPLKLLFSIVILAGCGRSPEATCESYIKIRKGKWPTSEAIEKECVKDLSSLKERSPEGYKCAESCVAITEESIHDCLKKSCADRFTDEKSADLWRLGFAADSSGNWADEKPKKLSEEECKEGAWAISNMKVDVGVIKEGERAGQGADLFKACKAGKDDAIYVKSFACLRRVTKRDQILDCSPPSLVSGPDGVSAAKIEGCVSECTDKHGRSANAAYMSCFNQCKAR